MPFAFRSLPELKNLFLAEVHNPPPGLYVMGNESLLRSPSIAIVGTRRASAYGVRAAIVFSKTLSSWGLTIVSGLARGIDSAAHSAAIEGAGSTIAVLGHGLDRVYPPENRLLVTRILESNGTLVSEYPPGTPAAKHHFPARNRIIAGLTLGTLVIEAGGRSGSLITARLALENNRDVFAVPGPFDDEGFTGTHRLIQMGAKLVTHPREVLEELPRWAIKPMQKDGELLASRKPNSALKDFLKREGVVTLQALYDGFLSARENLLSELELGLKEGWIRELLPQQYIYFDPLEVCDVGLAK